jgi:cob(I)alamin adenosyltransferase
LKIYTKTGDGGATSLFGGARVKKDSLRIASYGSVDELNSVLGICRTCRLPKKADAILDAIQNDLFVLGADLATPQGNRSKNVLRIEAPSVTGLERHIDELEESLPQLKSFILPGGSEAGATLHFARTVCRRAEREVVALAGEESIGVVPIVYLNRLSDLLFVLARWCNVKAGKKEVKWTPRGDRKL